MKITYKKYGTKMYFAFTIIEELCQFIQDNQLDRFILVNDTLCIEIGRASCRERVC